MRKINNKKVLYESIMRNVSKEVKKILNESFDDDGITLYVGDVICINHLDNGDSPIDDSRYDGKIGTVKYIDNMGQAHGTWGSLAVIPGVDDYTVIDHEDIDDEIF